jgi:hypothetical protein
VQRPTWELLRDATDLTERDLDSQNLDSFNVLIWIAHRVAQPREGYWAVDQIVDVNGRKEEIQVRTARLWWSAGGVRR